MCYFLKLPSILEDVGTKEGVLMISNQFPISLAFAAVMLLSSSLALAQGLSAEDALSRFDRDHDGTLSQREVVRAARAHFRALDPDADGTIDVKEAAAVGITKAELDKADLNKDGTLDEKEFISIVVKRFKEANGDSDKTLDAKELGTPAGQALLMLLQ